MNARRAVIASLLALIAGLALQAFAGRPSAARAGSVVKTVTFRGARFDVVELPLSKWNVRVDWADGGTRLKDVTAAVRTNAGIFEPGSVPTGLLISDGVISALWAEGAGREADLEKGPFAGVITARPR